MLGWLTYHFAGLGRPFTPVLLAVPKRREYGCASSSTEMMDNDRPVLTLNDCNSISDRGAPRIDGALVEAKPSHDRFLRMGEVLAE
jgi:hypothetical protein